MYGIYANMDPINIPPMLPYIPYRDPMGHDMSVLQIIIFAKKKKDRKSALQRHTSYFGVLGCWWMFSGFCAAKTGFQQKKYRW